MKFIGKKGKIWWYWLLAFSTYLLSLKLTGESALDREQITCRLSVSVDPALAQIDQHMGKLYIDK